MFGVRLFGVFSGSSWRLARGEPACHIRLPAITTSATRCPMATASIRGVLLSLLLSTGALANQFMKVNSFPAGAKVFIDDVEQGVAPIKVAVTVGRHDVR